MVDAIEPDIAGAFDLSFVINDFENRPFLQSCADRDIEKLSPPVRERLVKTADMTLAEYREGLARRDEIRAAYAELAADCDACVALGAVGPAPEGLGSTGNPQMNVAASLLGIPAITTAGVHRQRHAARPAGDGICQPRRRRIRGRGLAATQPAS